MPSSSPGRLRYVRIRVSTGLRWIGHDQKCFRFEVAPSLLLQHGGAGAWLRPAVPGHQQPDGQGRGSRLHLPHGGTLCSKLVSCVQWSPPMVGLAGGQAWQLEGRYYLLRVSHDEHQEETVVVHNTSDHSLVLASPLWGSLYGAELTCWQAGVALACGALSLVATPEVSAACRAHSSFCREEDQVWHRV